MRTFKFMALSMLFLGAVSCSEKEEPAKDPVLQPIREVVAKDGEVEVKAEIDHAAKTIKFASFVNTEDMSAVEVKFTVAEGATLVSPGLMAKVDLSKPVEVVVNNAVVDLTYTMTAEKPIINPVKKAGFEVAEQFTNLPKHIAVYQNKKLGDSKNVDGFIVEVSKEAKFAVLGTGNYQDKTSISLADWTKKENGWTIYMNGICGMKGATITGGKIVYSSGSTFPVFAVEKDGKFIVCPQHHQKDDKGAYVNYLEKMDKTGKVIKSNWLPEVAFGGYYMVVADGKALSDEEMKKTGMFNTWFNGDATSGREFIGVNKAGDKAYFFVNGKANGGLSMRAVVNIMLEIGCENVMTMEGSSSANFMVRSQKGIEGNDGTKITSNVLVIK